MIFGSVCSGIEAASVAWHPLGWRAAWFAEIAPFPSAVLAHRWPTVPNRGDFTTIGGDDAIVDVLIGGTPCQSFSVAGLRGGLDDERGALTLEYLRLVDRIRPRWVVWENVAGVLSTDGGRAFGAFLGGLEKLGYGWAYRVLDAQYFGVAQRRRRVFVVAHARGAWQRAGAVLFEPASLFGDPAASRSARPRVAVDARRSADKGSIARTLTTSGQRFDADSDTFVVDVLPFDTTQVTSRGNYSAPRVGDPCHPLAARAHAPAICFNARQNPDITGDISDCLGAQDRGHAVLADTAIRRLTPRECERLQGFPDDHTLVPYRGKLAADGPRYAAIGNSMAVPVIRWIGERIAAADAEP